MTVYLIDSLLLVTVVIFPYYLPTVHARDCREQDAGPVRAIRLTGV